eukprot:365719-Chlamydomonas_euryale.AAC.2
MRRLPLPLQTVESLLSDAFHEPHSFTTFTSEFSPHLTGRWHRLRRRGTPLLALSARPAHAPFQVCALCPRLTLAIQMTSSASMRHMLPAGYSQAGFSAIPTVRRGALCGPLEQFEPGIVGTIVTV